MLVTAIIILPLLLLLLPTHPLSVPRPGTNPSNRRPAGPRSPMEMASGDGIGRVRGANGEGHIDRNANDGSCWRIWSVVDHFEGGGSPSSAGEKSRAVVRCDLAVRVARILRSWAESWAGRAGWHTLLNKKSLLHEVEESVAVLQLFHEWLERRSQREGNPPPVTLVDVCCGKGILSMLASYLFGGKTPTHVSRIVMLDKQEDINWNHIAASNERAEVEGRPSIETWGGCNLHDIDQMVQKLEERSETDNAIDNGPIALVGIHLCKLLSPSCAGIANLLGPEKCPFFCLAPCCLPRVVRNLAKSNASKAPNRSKRGITVPVRAYESAEERQSRLEANQRRDGARKRTFADVPCYLCSEIHPIHKCNLLPPDENERIDIFQKAAALNPCWKCGEIGHFRADCPNTQTASKPRLALPPTIDLDVSPVIRQTKNGSQSKGPFEIYCDLLATGVQRDHVEVLDVGLVNNSAQHGNAANRDNWNRGRKSIFIVASALQIK